MECTSEAEKFRAPAENDFFNSIGQKQKYPGSRGRSVLPSKAHFASLPRHVGSVPLTEEASPHSITSSASASSVGDTSRPSDLAVLRLIRSLNVTGCCTGISPGLSPFSILSTTAAERRKISAWSGP